MLKTSLGSFFKCEFLCGMCCSCHRINDLLGFFTLDVETQPLASLKSNNPWIAMFFWGYLSEFTV